MKKPLSQMAGAPLDRSEMEHRLAVLRREGNSVSAAARALGISRAAMQNTIRRARTRPDVRVLDEVGRRFIDKKQPGLEAQLTNLADEIAYNNHDIDDGLRSGLLTVQQMSEVSLFARYRTEVERLFPGISGRRAINETVRRMINALVEDLIHSSRANIRNAGVTSIDDVRNAPPLIAFSDTMKAEAQELKRFLRNNLYQHYQVNRMTSKARRIVTDLFGIFLAGPQLLPPDYQLQGDDTLEQARKVADYIAGMTDRYAMREYRRLFAVDEDRKSVV